MPYGRPVDDPPQRLYPQLALPTDAIHLGLAILKSATLDATMAQLIEATRDAYKAEQLHTY